MRLVYVFDYRASDGYVCRVPVLLARLLCWVRTDWDYAPSPDGY